MSNSLLVHTQAIPGFDHLKWSWIGRSVTASITRQKGRFRCARCDSPEVTATHVANRIVRGLPVGRKPLDSDVRMHRLKCHECDAYLMERLPFVPSPRARITRSLERTVVELRAEMSISALSKHYQLDWKTVKEAEKRSLKRKYRTIRLADVRVIGIDEIHVGHSRYKTIVRDLGTGAVLYVGDGRGGPGLKAFERRLASSTARIETVAMDMSAGYAAWVKTHLPDAVIVYDHFHVIQLMNKRVDEVRRRTVKELAESDAKALKKKRFLFLRNREDLDQESTDELDRLQTMFADPGTSTALKERLRSIYALADDPLEAEWLMAEWCRAADQSAIPEIAAMAKTIRTHIEGILAYWTNDRVTSAAMEGFNNKIRWLIRQAYGYRDQEYFKLKIYDLPNVRTERDL